MKLEAKLKEYEHFFRFLMPLIAFLPLYGVYTLQAISTYFAGDGYYFLNLKLEIVDSLLPLAATVSFVAFMKYFAFSIYFREHLFSWERSILKLREKFVVKYLSGFSYSVGISIVAALISLQVVSLIFGMSMMAMQISEFTPLMEPSQWYGMTDYYTWLSWGIFSVVVAAFILFPRKRTASEKTKNTDSLTEDEKESIVDGLTLGGVLFIYFFGPMMLFCKHYLSSFALLSDSKARVLQTDGLYSVLIENPTDLAASLLYLAIIAGYVVIIKTKLKRPLLRTLNTTVFMPLCITTVVGVLGCLHIAQQKLSKDVLSDNALIQTVEINGHSISYKTGMLSMEDKSFLEEGIYELALGHRAIIGANDLENLIVHSKHREEAILATAAKIMLKSNAATEQARSNIEKYETTPMSLTDAMYFMFLDIYQGSTHYGVENEMYRKVVDGEYQGYLNDYLHYFLNREALSTGMLDGFYSSSSVRREKEDDPTVNSTIGMGQHQLIASLILITGMGNIDIDDINNEKTKERFVNMIADMSERYETGAEDSDLSEGDVEKLIQVFK